MEGPGGCWEPGVLTMHPLPGLLAGGGGDVWDDPHACNPGATDDAGRWWGYQGQDHMPAAGWARCWWGAGVRDSGPRGRPSRGREVSPRPAGGVACTPSRDGPAQVISLPSLLLPLQRLRPHQLPLRLGARQGGLSALVLQAVQ